MTKDNSALMLGGLFLLLLMSGSAVQAARSQPMAAPTLPGFEPTYDSAGNFLGYKPVLSPGVQP